MWLDSIQLPFILSSILFALYSIKPKNNNVLSKKAIVLSGIFLGLAVFTKIPAFSMVPLIAFIIFRKRSSRTIRMITLWLVPVILIPLIWPAYSLAIGQFSAWVDGIHAQTSRAASSPQYVALWKDLMMDPLLIGVGFAAIIFAAAKRDYLLALWTIPFLSFEILIGFVQIFHIIPILPALCIGISKLIVDLSEKTKRIGIQRILPYIVITGIGYVPPTNPLTIIRG